MANPHREPSAAGSSATYRLGCDVWQLICQDLSLAITQATTEEEAQTSRAMLKALSETDRMLHDLSAPYLLRHPRFGRMTDQTEEHQSHGELVRAQLDSMALSPIFPQPPRTISLLPPRSTHPPRGTANLDQSIITFLMDLSVLFQHEPRRFKSLKRLSLTITRQDAQYLHTMSDEILASSLITQARVLETIPCEPQYLASFTKVQYLVLHGVEGGRWAREDAAVDLLDVMEVIKQMPSLSHLEMRATFRIDWVMILRELPRRQPGKLQTIALEATGDALTDPRTMSIGLLLYIWGHLRHLKYLKPCAGGCDIPYCQPRRDLYQINAEYERMFVGCGVPIVSPSTVLGDMQRQVRMRAGRGHLAIGTVLLVAVLAHLLVYAGKIYLIY